MINSLNDIPAHSVLFLDANIFIYHYTGTSEQCKNLIQRCERKEIIGQTSSIVLLEVCHRLMILEAKNKELITGKNLPNKLKKNPDIIKQLYIYQQSIQNILEMGIEVYWADSQCVQNSHQLRKIYGLLTNDSYNLAIIQEQRIPAIATYDSDFDHISNLQVFKPMDI